MSYQRNRFSVVHEAKQLPVVPLSDRKFRMIINSDTKDLLLHLATLAEWVVRCDNNYVFDNLHTLGCQLKLFLFHNLIIDDDDTRFEK